jgi:MSHA pilin protein MshC
MVIARTACAPCRNRSRIGGSGFTLVELIAVLVLTGILAGVAIPAIGSISSTRVAAAQRQIQRDLSYARERAAMTGARTWAVFSLASNAYSILGEPVGQPGRANAITLTDPATGRGYITSIGQEFPTAALQSVSFDGGAEVGFDWRGAPLNQGAGSLSAPGIVTITGNRTVTIRPGSGLVTVP